MITFRILSPHAALTALISSVTASNLCSFAQPMLITISISFAPSSIACFASATLIEVVEYPRGKPITVHILTSLYLL